MRPGMGGRLLVAPPPATPAFSIAVSNSAPSVVQGGTVDYTATLTRVGGHTADVVLSITGLPADVSASFPDGDTFSGGTTTRTVRLTAAGGATLVNNDAFVLTATSSEAGPDTENQTVSVVAAGSFAANLPSGMTLIADSSFESFTSTTASSSDADGIEVINWASNITEDAASFGVRSSDNSGGHGSKSIRAWFPGDHAGEGVGPLTLMVSGINAVEHYMACRMRYSPGYVFHTNSEKLFYPVENVAGEGNWGASPLNVGANRELVGASGPIQTAPVGEPKTAAGVIPNDGSWFDIECYGKMNTPGNSDGEWKAWVNGVNVMNITSWQFSNHPSTQMLYSLGRRDLTRGGGVSSLLTPAGGQWVEIDRLAFYKR